MKQGKCHKIYLWWLKSLRLSRERGGERKGMRGKVKADNVADIFLKF